MTVSSEPILQVEIQQQEQSLCVMLHSSASWSLLLLQVTCTSKLFWAYFSKLIQAGFIPLSAIL